MFTCAILFLVSLYFVALVDPFDPYSPFKSLIFYYSSLALLVWQSSCESKLRPLKVICSGKMTWAYIVA